MSIHFRCPSCRGVLAATDAQAGQDAWCEHCSRYAPVPKPEPGTSVAPGSPRTEQADCPGCEGSLEVRPARRGQWHHCSACGAAFRPAELVAPVGAAREDRRWEVASGVALALAAASLLTLALPWKLFMGFVGACIAVVAAPLAAACVLLPAAERRTVRASAVFALVIAAASLLVHGGIQKEHSEAREPRRKDLRFP